MRKVYFIYVFPICHSVCYSFKELIFSSRPCFRIISFLCLCCFPSSGWKSLSLSLILSFMSFLILWIWKRNSNLCFRKGTVIGSLMLLYILYIDRDPHSFLPPADSLSKEPPEILMLSMGWHKTCFHRWPGILIRSHRQTLQPFIPLLFPAIVGMERPPDSAWRLFSARR